MLILFDFGFNFNYGVMEIHSKLISGHEESDFSESSFPSIRSVRDKINDCNPRQKVYLKAIRLMS